MTWNGTVELRPGQVSYFGTCGEIPLHSSVAIGVLAVVGGPVELYDTEGRVARLHADGPATVILPAGASTAAPRPDTGTDGPSTVVLGIVDPDGTAGRVLAARLAAVPPEIVGPDRWVAAAEPCSGTPHRPGPDDPAGTRLI